MGLEWVVTRMLCCEWGNCDSLSYQAFLEHLLFPGIGGRTRKREVG